LVGGPVKEKFKKQVVIYIQSEKLVMKKLLLFDLDWTLLYTGGAGIRAFNHAFDQLFGIAQALSTVTVDGKTDMAIARELIQVHLKRNAHQDEIRKLCDAYVARLAEEVPAGPGFRVLPGIPELLAILAQRTDIVMGLGTGNLKAGAQIKLARPNLWHYFSFGGFADDAEIRADVLRAGVKRGEAIAGQTFAARDVIVIGDNWRDVDAGKAIGATTVAVASGPMKAEELTTYQPDYLFNDLSDTDKVLKAFF